MKNFAEFINEANKDLSPTDVKNIEKLIKIIDRHGDQKLIFRGFRKTMKQMGPRGAKTVEVGVGIEFVANTKGRVVRGTNKNVFGPEDEMMTGIVKGLGLTYDPIFTAPSDLHSVFGKPLAFIPAGAFKAFTHPKITDMVSGNPFIGKKDPAEIAKEYKSYSNKMPSSPKGEIIFDGKGYYLIDLGNIVFRMTRAKYKTFTSVKQVKTYKDLSTLLREYLKVLQWATDKGNMGFVSHNSRAEFNDKNAGKKKPWER